MRASHVDEDLVGPIGPVEAARELALRKALAVAKDLAAFPPRWVLGADTVVALGSDEAPILLGKPTDPADAQRMLASLSGTRHRVVTGICVVRTQDGAHFLDEEDKKASKRK